MEEWQHHLTCVTDTNVHISGHFEVLRLPPNQNLGTY